MALIPLLITTVCYLWVAAGFIKEGNVGLCIAVTGYAFANAGFIYIVIGGQP
jgi:hypothetical protein